MRSARSAALARSDYSAIDSWLNEGGADCARQVPVGLRESGVRRESDAFGTVLVAADRYWGAQTQRCLDEFAFGDGDRMPLAVFHAYGKVKQAAAEANRAAGVLSPGRAALIVQAAVEVSAGAMDSECQLGWWQSGSGTHMNMNVNEVIANRCSQLVGRRLGSHDPVHPNDHVNLSQSSNDTFITVMHLVAYESVVDRMLPALKSLVGALEEKVSLWKDVSKVGRTHLQDAVPMTVGQEWSAFSASVAATVHELEDSVSGLLELAVGGTAVGTGLNAPSGFVGDVIRRLQGLTGYPVVEAVNAFAAISTIDKIVTVHGAVRNAAGVLFKIANDLRLLGSGPHAGLNELRLPATGPGSSAMPGKVNPTHAEALMMVCVQVMGADVSIQIAASHGTLQLNTLRPMVIGNFLHSADTIAAATKAFQRHLVEPTRINSDQLQRNIEQSTMSVTALVPIIGYDRSTTIADYATGNHVSLREAAQHHGVDPTVFDSAMNQHQP